MTFTANLSCICFLCETLVLEWPLNGYYTYEHDNSTITLCQKCLSEDEINNAELVEHRIALKLLET